MYFIEELHREGAYEQAVQLCDRLAAPVGQCLHAHQSLVVPLVPMPVPLHQCPPSGGTTGINASTTTPESDGREEAQQHISRLVNYMTNQQCLRHGATPTNNNTYLYSLTHQPSNYVTSQPACWPMPAWPDSHASTPEFGETTGATILCIDSVNLDGQTLLPLHSLVVQQVSLTMANSCVAWYCNKQQLYTVKID